MLFAQESDCILDPAFQTNLNLEKAINETENQCSEVMVEAIKYKEEDEAVLDAEKELKPLCSQANNFTPSCIIFSKDGDLDNPTIAKVCEVANEMSPLCILTALSKKTTNETLISLCSKASQITIDCMNKNLTIKECIPKK